MVVNVAGLIVLAVFYAAIFVVGMLAARRKGRLPSTTSMERSIVAGRDINVYVGIFTMTATTVGGGYINGTAESIATAGLAWTLAPLGIFIGMSLGGLIYAKPMRSKSYLTMLDPFYDQFGSVVVLLIYLASLCGDLLWTASILSALGSSLSVIVNLDLTIAIVTASSITVMYTMVGQMVSVAYTDILQLIFIMFGLVLSLPFVLTNERVNLGEMQTSDWLGSIETSMIPQWVDLLIAMTFGTIPWQSYFQRVLSVKTARDAQLLSVMGASFALVLVVPSVLIGAAGQSADWNGTSLGISPVAADKAPMILPYVLNEFTPRSVSIVGLGALSAAVMSSMDSAILGSSSMFTNNIYRQVIRQQATDSELLWVQRVAVFVVGAIATLISIYVPIIYGLFILAADIVFVIVLPQLTCALFIKFSNTYGAIFGYIIGFLLRLGAGESYIGLDPFIRYPGYDDNLGQVFPFRTFAMFVSFFSIILVSLLTNFLFESGLLPENVDILKCIKRSQNFYHITSVHGAEENVHVIGASPTSKQESWQTIPTQETELQ